MSDIEITFIQPDGSRQRATAKNNQSIMQTALENKIKGIEGLCGGCIGCATCHIYIPEEWQSRVNKEDNEQSEEEKDMLETAENVKNTSRLGCQIKLTKALNQLIISLPTTQK
ncbi:MAG: 2Fe-2S iron-sulfur cluster-binding protein [Bdellovibrionales bacterium]